MRNSMSYVVIFKAQIQNLDIQYIEMAQHLRAKALSQFNCQKFESLCELDQEIALSYWHSLADIQAWHHDAEHLIAQRLGKEQWYRHFSVEICEVVKSYQFA